MGRIFELEEVALVKKKVYLIIAIFALITLLTQIPYLIGGISERGLAGVNYGRVIFPFLISVIVFLMYRKKD